MLTGKGKENFVKSRDIIDQISFNNHSSIQMKNILYIRGPFHFSFVYSMKRLGKYILGVNTDSISFLECAKEVLFVF